MHPFHKIINHYFQNNDILNKEIYIIFFNIFTLKKYSIKEKYLLLDHFLNRNMFFTKEMHKEILNIFQEIQQKYLNLQHFIYMIKYKKSKIVIKTDLSLNPISENDKNVICIYQNHHRYLFNIRELIQLVNTSLIHSEYFFSCPLISKNPYNNIILNKSTLYNIYFFMRLKTLYFSEILHYYFKNNFHLSNFQEKHEYLLRNYAIEDFLKNESSQQIDLYIKSMIHEHNEIFTGNSICIHNEFPLERKIEIMRPYLKLYLLSKYSLSYHDKSTVKKELARKLIRFHHFNHKFGRKMIKIIYKTKMNHKYIEKVFVYFIDKHVCFYEDKKDEFLDSHRIKHQRRNHGIFLYNDDDDDEDDDFSIIDDNHDNNNYEDNHSDDNEEVEEDVDDDSDDNEEDD